MESRARLMGHPIHPMLVCIPLGLLGTSLLFDITYLITHNGQWAIIAYWLIMVGLIGGMIASPFGTVDWLAIPSGTRAKRVGLLHGMGNVVVLLLFGVGWLLRMKVPELPSALSIWLSVGGVLLSVLTGWLGGELVNRLGVGVYPGANLNASNSLMARSEEPGQTAPVASAATEELPQQ